MNHFISSMSVLKCGGAQVFQAVKSYDFPVKPIKSITLHSLQF